MNQNTQKIIEIIKLSKEFGEDIGEKISDCIYRDKDDMEEIIFNYKLHIKIFLFSVFCLFLFSTYNVNGWGLIPLNDFFALYPIIIFEFLYLTFLFFKQIKYKDFRDNIIFNFKFHFYMFISLILILCLMFCILANQTKFSITTFNVHNGLCILSFIFISIALELIYLFFLCLRKIFLFLKK